MMSLCPRHCRSANEDSNGLWYLNSPSTRFFFDDSESQKRGDFFEGSFCPSGDFGGMDCIMLSGPCLDWGSGTLLRHSAKRASGAGAEGDVVDMIDLCEEKGLQYVYYVKKADVCGTFWSKAPIFSKITEQQRKTCRRTGLLPLPRSLLQGG